ncbi:MAG TPA: DUF1080 domain-containing protein [Bacteroidales bacterium]|nr:DUF1080 domain-containing protein [Bacteroidales bacterium]
MKNLKMINRALLFLICNLFVFHIQGQDTKQNEWQSLFDGKILNGWQANENKEVFTVSKGMIVAKGGRSHLFYTGPISNANFKNFELKADVMTEPGTNSGIFIHTKFQDEGWPKTGYEIQINNSSTDKQMTGSIYNIVPDSISPVKDMEWFTINVIVNNQNVVVEINNRTVANYTERDPQKPISIFTGGTIALQGHSEGSMAYFKNIYIKSIK